MQSYGRFFGHTYIIAPSITDRVQSIAVIRQNRLVGMRKTRLLCTVNDKERGFNPGTKKLVGWRKRSLKTRRLSCALGFQLTNQLTGAPEYYT